MIPFLRNFRKKFLSENRVTKYLVYALGEIILVVIGILIALQVNTWNEMRKEQQQAVLLKQNIRREFLRNQQLLDTILQQNQKAFDANYQLIELVGAEATALAQHNLDSLFYQALLAESFLPSNHTVDEAMRSGGIDLIGDEALKNTLLQWGTQLDLIKIYKGSQSDWQNQQLLPLMNRYVSLRQTDMYGSKSWGGKSHVPFRYEPLFQLLEFENILDNNLYLIQFLIDRLQEIRQTQDEVLARTAGGNP